ncbi:MAG: sensor histidine kinase [Polyangiaceae bacterium]|nr:sensor histidine kinase [Polyangiaceae bacterium]
MWPALRALFGEDRPRRPRTPSVLDRALVFVLVPTAIAEGLLRDGLAMRPVEIAIAVIVVGTLWFRRTHPLGAVGVAFGLAIASIGAAFAGVEINGLYTQTCLLLLPYSLLRWGSGREIAVGLAIVAGTYVVSALRGDMKHASDAIGSAMVLLFPAVLGASVRFRDDAHRRDVDHARLREREVLARELHDTVAHHVAAIAIQAQGGRAVLATRPEAAASALAAIEDEAARALAELRILVSALRDDPRRQHAPPAGIEDLGRLAQGAGDGPAVEIELVGALDALAPSVQAAIYRMAQESITNARRHARKATRIHVRLAAEDASVRLTVRDDGERTAARPRSGFGLVGMTERAQLLGGTLRAGPDDRGGWTVEAVLPRTRGAA